MVGSWAAAYPEVTPVSTVLLGVGVMLILDVKKV